MTVVMKRFSGRTFNTRGMRTVDSRIALRGPAPCAAEAVFAKAKAFLSSREARQMSASDLERELHRRHQELVGKLLQAHRDQRSPRETAGPAEGTSAGTVDGAGTVEGTSAGAVDGTSGVECPERREHECDTETTSRTVQVPRPGCASRGHDVLHPLDAALNLPSVRYGVDVCHRTTIATAARAPPCTLLPVTAALDLVRAAGPRRSTKKSRTRSLLTAVDGRAFTGRAFATALLLGELGLAAAVALALDGDGRNANARLRWILTIRVDPLVAGLFLHPKHRRGRRRWMGTESGENERVK